MTSVWADPSILPEKPGQRREALHVVLVAYAIDPTRGSEPGNAWQWLRGLAGRVQRVTLVTTPESASALRQASVELLPSNAAVIDVPARTEALMRPFPQWYRRYAGWLDCAAEALGDIDGDVAQHVTVGSPFWGSSLHTFTGPRVLGPVGISHAPPVGLLPRFGIGDMAEEMVRGQLGQHPARWRRGLAGVRGASRVLAADPRTAAMDESVGVSWTRELLEGVRSVRPDDRDVPGPTYVWAGKMVRRKAPLLAVQAWQRAAPPKGASLVMLGDGPERRAVELAVSQSGLSDSIHVLGKVSPTEVSRHLEESRALLFTSLRDTSSSQMLEAMAVGTPVVSLRHAGVGGLDLWYPRELGWARSAASWRGSVAALAEAIRASIHSPDSSWTRRSRASRSVAQTHLWSRKVDRAIGVYRELLT